MKHIQYLYILFVVILSCKNGSSQKQESIINGSNLQSIDIDLFLKGKKWIEIIKIDSKYVNYKKCNSENRFIELINNSFIENVGQEIFKCKTESINKGSELIYTLKINSGCSYDDIFKLEILDINKKIVKWSNKLYSFVSTDSSLLGNYEVVNQPCTDCFSKEECEGVSYVDTNNNNESFFSKPETIISPSQNWFGEYYFEERETGKVILISKDKMTYEATGMRYQSKYELSANQVGDTLGLYYHKGLSGNSDNLEVYLPLIKLYKKGGKHYIKSILTDDDWKETEVEKF